MLPRAGDRGGLGVVGEPKLSCGEVRGVGLLLGFFEVSMMVVGERLSLRFLPLPVFLGGEGSGGFLRKEAIVRLLGERGMLRGQN